MLNKFLFVVLVTSLILLSLYALRKKDQAAQFERALKKSHELELNYQIERERQYSLTISLKKENDALKQRLKLCNPVPSVQ